MDNLFEKLKSEPAINRLTKTVSPSSSADNSATTSTLAAGKIIGEICSLPKPSVSDIGMSNKSKRCRHTIKYLPAPKLCKPVTVRVLDCSKLKNYNAKFNTICKNTKVLNRNGYETNEQTAVDEEVRINPIYKNTDIKKYTPTKAAQKLFDPPVLKNPNSIAAFRVKKFCVRLHRCKLEELDEIIHHPNQQQDVNENAIVSPEISQKRKSTSLLALPAKKLLTQTQSKRKKKEKEFHIKLPPVDFNPLQILIPPTLNGKHSINSSKKKLKTSRRAIPKLSTKPTKITRSKIIKTFGDRFLKCHIKIERCQHPLMVIFESNAKARKLQAKREKVKKSVYFHEEVEILGYQSYSGSESNSCVDPSDILECYHQTFGINKEGGTPAMTDVTSSGATNICLDNGASVMPARLKKVENGKVVNDIELDTSLFHNPSTTNASAPLISPSCAHMRERRTFLLLNDLPSGRKDQLKLANEKLPPIGLRGLHIEDADDEDDDEYIVPTDVLPLRNLHSGSSKSCELSNLKPTAAILTNNTGSVPNAPIRRTDRTDSSESFVSCDDNIPTTPSRVNIENQSVNFIPLVNSTLEYGSTETSDCANLEKKICLARIDQPSPVPSLSSINDLVDSIISQPNKINALSEANEVGIPTMGIVDEDISMLLFDEAQTQITTGDSSFQNDIVNDLLESQRLPSELTVQTPTASLTIPLF